MLSYRHAFHAGNHADVLKHVALLAILDHLRKKETPLLAVDTHAGGGFYRLNAEPARKLAEFQEGIGRLWRDGHVGQVGQDKSASPLPQAVAAYLEAVRELNPDGNLRRYPGSPWLFCRGLRAADRACFFDLHPNEIRILEATLPAGNRTRAEHGDGLAALKSLLPPPSRRAVVLIDPSYEVRADYVAVEKTLRDTLKRFATGCYIVWYPLIARPEARKFPERLQKLALADSASPRKTPWLNASLSVRAAEKGERPGMWGSGLFVLNPPWTLAETLKETLPWLCERLRQDQGASWTLAVSEE